MCCSLCVSNPRILSTNSHVSVNDSVRWDSVSSSLISSHFISFLSHSSPIAISSADWLPFLSFSMPLIDFAPKGHFCVIVCGFWLFLLLLIFLFILICFLCKSFLLPFLLISRHVVSLLERHCKLSFILPAVQYSASQKGIFNYMYKIELNEFLCTQKFLVDTFNDLGLLKSYFIRIIFWKHCVNISI